MLSSGVSPELSAIKPAFTVRAGRRGSTALRALLERVPDVLRSRGIELHVVEADPDAVAGYSYGTDHAIHDLEAVTETPSVGAVRVFGASDVGEAVDAAAVRSGGARVVVIDDALDAPARVDARASTVLRRAVLATETGRLVAGPNFAQEIGDVVEVTHAPLGLDARRYRVSGLRYRFERERRPRVEMQLTLTAP